MRGKKRYWLTAILAALALLVALLYPKWRKAGEIGGQKPVPPFRIAGNFYYVGANDVTSYLITSPAGHILIDGGYPRTPSLIMRSIKALGFDIKDVKILLNSEPHYDHAGGLAALQNASGAQLWVSGPSAPVIARGGYDPSVIFPIKILFWLGITHYPEPHVDHVLQDGETIRLGGNEITAYITPGHTKGCTSFAFMVDTLRVVSACSLVAMGAQKNPDYKTDFEKTFRVLRGLDADIWVTAHARAWGRFKKFSRLGNAKDSVAAFIDPAGFRAYVDTAEARIRRGVKN